MLRVPKPIAPDPMRHTSRFVPAARAAAVRLLCVCTCAALTLRSHAQSVPGFVVSPHASGVSGPVWLSFDSTGALYCGRDATASGTPDPRFITRIGPGGSPVADWGVSATPDPDAVAVDTLGAVSGVPGSVLVGGSKVLNVSGSIRAIRPDQSVVELWQSSQWLNPSEMKFDSNGRLVFADANTRQLRVSVAGESPTLIATLPAGSTPGSVAIAPDNRIFVADTNGRVFEYTSNGTLLNGNFITLPGRISIEFGAGGAWGFDLYAINNASGALLRISANGAATTIGSGFTSGFCDLAVGPDKRLYVGRFNAGDVLAIGPSGWSNYCTAGTTTNGCTPSMQLVSGTPSASGAGSAIVSALRVEGARQGLIFFGLGATAQPWSATSSSFLCIKSPTQRSPATNSGGLSPSCDGVLSADLNALIAGNGGNVLANLPIASGSSVYAQAWFRDPPASKSTNLSDALQLTLAP